MTYYIYIASQRHSYFLQTLRAKADVKSFLEIQKKALRLSKKKNIYTKNHSRSNYNKAKLEILSNLSKISTRYLFEN